MDQRLTSVDDFKIMGQLAYSKHKIFKIYDKNLKTEVALKEINTEDSQELVEKYQEDIEVMKKIDHPNIIKIFGNAYLHQKNKNIFIIEEIAQYNFRDLIEMRKEKQEYFKEMELKTITLALLNAFIALQELDLFHGRLRPENILLIEDGRIVVCDVFPNTFKYMA